MDIRFVIMGVLLLLPVFLLLWEIYRLEKKNEELEKDVDALVKEFMRLADRDISKNNQLKSKT